MSVDINAAFIRSGKNDSYVPFSLNAFRDELGLSEQETFANLQNFKRTDHHAHSRFSMRVGESHDRVTFQINMYNDQTFHFRMQQNKEDNTAFFSIMRGQMRSLDHRDPDSTALVKMMIKDCTHAAWTGQAPNKKILNDFFKLYDEQWKKRPYMVTRIFRSIVAPLTGYGKHHAN